MSAQVSSKYSNRTNAVRGAKRALGSDSKEGEHFDITDMGGDYFWVEINFKPELLLDGVRRKSLVEKPCIMVWSIADSMEGSTRKEIIAACKEAGIADNTITTQYQAWSRAKRNQP